MRKTVLALLQINVNFVLIPRKFVPDLLFRIQSHKFKKIFNRWILNSKFTLENLANLLNINE